MLGCVTAKYWVNRLPESTNRVKAGRSGELNIVEISSFSNMTITIWSKFGIAVFGVGAGSDRLGTIGTGVTSERNEQEVMSKTKINRRPANLFDMFPFPTSLVVINRIYTTNSKKSPFVRLEMGALK